MKVEIELEAYANTEQTKEGVEKKVRLVMDNMEHVYFDYWDETLQKTVPLRFRVKSVRAVP